MSYRSELKKALKAAGMTQAELAAAIGVSKAAVSQYLSGTCKPSPERMEQIAEVLEIPTENSDTDSDNTTLSPMRAAELMHKSKEFVYQGLRDGVFPWGYAVKMGRSWSYYISPIKFTECTGIRLEEAG